MSMINHYDIMLELITQSADFVEQNIAYRRICHWIYEIFDSSVLIGNGHHDLIAWQDTKSRCLMIPDDPVDQLVGIMLHCKLTAMIQHRLVISSLSISSSRDEHIVYHHDDGDECGCFAEPGWWNNAGPMWQNKKRRSKTAGKVISLSRQCEWKDLDLDWNEKQTNSVIVTADFGKDDKE